MRQLARFLISFLPKHLQRALFGAYWARRAPDRVFMEQNIYPLAKGRILAVGCSKYTKVIPDSITLDIDPDNRKYGAREHIVGDVITAKLPESNTILCSGVFGFGVNSVADQQAALDNMASALVPGGALYLSWCDYRGGRPPLDLSKFREVMAGRIEAAQYEYVLLEKI